MIDKVSLGLTPEKMDEAIKRILSKAIPEPNCGCLLWTAAITSAGYGLVWLGNRYLGAHVASYVLFNGAIPDGSCVCHKCDLRLCIEPSHLWLGSDLSNALDRETKGRGKQPTGSRHGSAKITEVTVIEARKKYATGNYSYNDLAIEYGVTAAVMWHAVAKTGRTWRHI